MNYYKLKNYKLKNRRRSGFVPVLLLLCLVFSIASPMASALDAPRLKSSDAYLVVDMNTGTEIIDKNPDMHHSIASLTKIMTCLLGVEAVEKGTVSLTDMVTAQSDCLQGLDTSSSNAGIVPGEIMSFQDLLYCALVHSANDACNVIATHVAGSISAFVQMMNARAMELGCENTHFMDTDGMLNRSDGHYSSPRDLYKIASEAMNHQLFARICSTADYTVSATNVREAFEVHNSNALMSTGGIYGDSYLYSGVSGIKTGFTKPAGYCLVSVCERVGERLMCIVLGCNGPLTYTFAGEYQNFEDSTTLYDWAFANFDSRTVFLAGEPLKRLSVTYAKDNGTVALCAAEDMKLFISKEIKDQDIVTEIHPYEDRLVAPITEGDELGYVDVYIAGELRGTVRLLADASVEMERGEMIKAKIKAFFTSSSLKIAVIVIISAVVLFFVYRGCRKVARRHKLRLRMAEKEQARWTEQSAVYAARENQRRAVRNGSAAGAAGFRDSGNGAFAAGTRSGMPGGEPGTAGASGVAEQARGETPRSTGRRIPIETLQANRAPGEQRTQYVPQPAPPQPAGTGQAAPSERTRMAVPAPEQGQVSRSNRGQYAGQTPESRSRQAATQVSHNNAVNQAEMYASQTGRAEYPGRAGQQTPLRQQTVNSADESQTKRRPVIHEGFSSSINHPGADQENGLSDGQTVNPRQQTRQNVSRQPQQGEPRQRMDPRQQQGAQQERKRAQGAEYDLESILNDFR